MNKKSEPTTSLRKEYVAHAKEKDDIITEAAFMWVERNVVLINEQIDRRTVKRIIDSISKFDSVFGKFKSKIPAISNLIHSAEDELQGVLTGKVTEKRAGDLLKKMSYFYTTFSNFFSSDLPVLLSSPIFSSARENPDVKLNVLQPKEGSRYDASVALKSLMHSLTPSKESATLLKKIYKTKLPLIDIPSIANQMLQLSYNELNELTQMDKIPAMATPEPEMPTEAPVQEVPPTVAPTTAGVPSGASPSQNIPTLESVGSLKKKDDHLILESHGLLLELNQKQMNKVIDIMNQLQSNFNIPGMEGVNKSLQALISKSRKEIASNKWLQGSAVKQLVGFYNLMDNLNQQWPQIKQLFADGKLEPQDQADLQKLMVSATQDSVFGKLAKAFKLQTPHAPGLDPNSVVKGVMGAANQENGLDAISALFEKAKGMPKTDPTTGEPKVQGTPDQAQKADQTSSPDKTVRATGTKQTDTATGTVPSAGAQEMDIEAIAKDVEAKTKVPKEQLGNWASQLKILQRAGYTIKKN